MIFFAENTFIPDIKGLEEEGKRCCHGYDEDGYCIGCMCSSCDNLFGDGLFNDEHTRGKASIDDDSDFLSNDQPKEESSFDEQTGLFNDEHSRGKSYFNDTTDHFDEENPGGRSSYYDDDNDSATSIYDN